MLDWKLLAGAAGIVAAVVFVIWLIFSAHAGYGSI